MLFFDEIVQQSYPCPWKSKQKVDEIRLYGAPLVVSMAFHVELGNLGLKPTC